MTITLSFGAWLIPAFITALAFGAAIILNQPDRHGRDDLAGGVIMVLFYGAAAIVSLLAWLIWAVLT